MKACLSPNGQLRSTGDGPLDRLFVATIRGILVFDRTSPDAPWRETGRMIEHKHISSLLIDEATGLMLAGCHGRGEEGGLFRSEDDGASWEPAMEGMASGHVYCVDLERRGDEIILYAGTEPPALYQSRDLGRSWRDLATLRDVPGTEHWIFPPPPHIAHVKTVAFHPDQPGTIYALVEQGALLRSTDDGASWIELAGYSSKDDSFYRDVHRVAIARRDPNRIHLATGDGLYFSADGGASWEHQQKRTDRVGYPDALFLDPIDDGTVYMGGAGDAPETWRVAGGAHAGFIVSRDGGRTWAEAMNGLPSPLPGNIEAMAMHGWNGGLAFYAGTAVGDLYGSEDGGGNWRLIAGGLPPISKARHYRHFLSADAKFALEEKGREERRAEGLADREYHTNA